MGDGERVSESESESESEARWGLLFPHTRNLGWFTSHHRASLGRLHHHPGLMIEWQK